MSRARTAAVIAAALIVATAALQLALAAGAPWGDHAYGGAASTTDGVLPVPFRIVSAAAAVVLLLAAPFVLTRARVARVSFLRDRLLLWLTWAIVGFLVLNTLGNFASESPFERWVMTDDAYARAALWHRREALAGHPRDGRRDESVRAVAEGVNLVIRFLSEVAAVIAVAYWGYRTGPGPIRWGLALLAPAAVIAV